MTTKAQSSKEERLKKAQASFTEASNRAREEHAKMYKTVESPCDEKYYQIEKMLSEIDRAHDDCIPASSTPVQLIVKKCNILVRIENEEGEVTYSEKEVPLKFILEL